MLSKNILSFVVITLVTLSVTAQKYKTTDMQTVTDQWNENIFTSDKTIAENISEAPELTILAKAMKDNAALQAALEKEEMVTIFITKDSAFANLPEKTRDSISENPILMASMVKFQTIPGRMDSYAIKDAVEKNGGLAYFSNLNGSRIGIKEVGGKLYLIDEENRTALLSGVNFYHKNGFFHIVDGVVLPPK
ncbi:fasciclin domain-containing protein [Aequorivita echinoideorum]|uniref:Fasciclin domain-containing protein n=1 Tax=Aequorivita echinoideorum TaxID=1549647 RepID=A0ABS5S5Z8_9FLAO|nr:fasciclin domain-containing protein [Aequorivita echinoideorum]MBT0608641.1 fasciclin domain-containing protein [Aequorivita echinoideorum]